MGVAELGHLSIFLPCKRYHPLSTSSLSCLRSGNQRSSNLHYLAVSTEVTFSLVYERLLQWHQGQYMVVVSMRPGQLMTRLSVEVTVSERMGIVYVRK